MKLTAELCIFCKFGWEHLRPGEGQSSASGDSVLAEPSESFARNKRAIQTSQWMFKSKLNKFKVSRKDGDQKELKVVNSVCFAIIQKLHKLNV